MPGGRRARGARGENRKIKKYSPSRARKAGSRHATSIRARIGTHIRWTYNPEIYIFPRPDPTPSRAAQAKISVRGVHLRAIDSSARKSSMAIAPSPCSNSTRKLRSIVPMVHALHKYQSHTPQSGARPSVRHPRRPFMCAAVRPAFRTNGMTSMSACPINESASVLSFHTSTYNRSGYLPTS